MVENASELFNVIHSYKFRKCKHMPFKMFSNGAQLSPILLFW